MQKELNRIFKELREQRKLISELICFLLESNGGEEDYSSEGKLSLEIPKILRGDNIELNHFRSYIN